MPDRKVTCPPQRSKGVRPHECVCLFVCVRKWWHCELMQRDGANLCLWNIHQRRPGNDISPTFTLMLSHRGQRGDVACVCLKWCVFRCRSFLLRHLKVFLLSATTDKVQLKGGSHAWKYSKKHVSAQMNCALTLRLKVMWANQVAYLELKVRICPALPIFTHIYSVYVSKHEANCSLEQLLTMSRFVWNSRNRNRCLWMNNKLQNA